ncbi:Sec20 protein [Rhizoctonia solani]|uniref:Sec20 protein n=1 Tax=Rhizoctonia solani TaxID=456999 RepID=A0A8H7H2W1_9AGAM|nr:Sec20 protein [Rhizoctonia solani]
MPPVASPLFIEAQTAHEALSRRIRDLGEFQIPRLRDCKGPLTLQQQYAAELRDDTEAITKRLEDFATLAEDQEREIERVQVKQWVNELYDELSRIKSDSRAALLASKRAIDSDARSRRDELLGSAALQQKRAAEAEAHKQRATEDKLMAASDDVTEALRRTTRLMQQELERSVLSTQMLQESSKTLRSTTDVYVNLDNLMDVSQVLIKALQRADWMDRIIIGLSFTVFLLTMAYIVKRRVLDRVVTVATLPLRLMGAGSSKVTTTEDMLTETTRTIKTLATSLTNTVQTAISASIPTTLDSLPTSSVREAVLDTVESAIETSLDPDIYTRICSDGICEFAESMTSIIADATSTVAFSVLPTVASLPHEEL